MEKKHRGAWAELVACGWLLKEGYEVYRNISPHGLCDILATLNGELFKFDVKTMIRGELAPVQLSAAQVEYGVLLLGVHSDGRCVINPAKADFGNAMCKECGAFFKKTQGKHAFCKKDCGIEYASRVQREARRARLTGQGKSDYQNTSSPNMVGQQKSHRYRVVGRNRVKKLEVFRGVIP